MHKQTHIQRYGDNVLSYCTKNRKTGNIADDICSGPANFINYKRQFDVIKQIINLHKTNSRQKVRQCRCKIPNPSL